MSTMGSRLAAGLIIAAVIVGCGTAALPQSPGASAAPPHTPEPSATPAGTTEPSPSPTAGALTVTSAAQAAALILESNELFREIAPLQPDLIGQSAWYEATENGDGYSVMVTLGSGDCLAGCINRRTWTYSVDRSGTIALVSEEGDELELGRNHGTSSPVTVTARLVAGPTCPVVQDPPDPNCADRPVVNGEVILRDPRGAEVARGVSDAQGVVQFSVPAGAYYLEPAPVEGVMGQAQPAAFSAVGGSALSVTLAYDTGIR